MTSEIIAKFGLGQIVRHREAAFRGVVIDVDPVFAGKAGETGEISPDQPFYQVLALGAASGTQWVGTIKPALPCDAPEQISPLSSRVTRSPFCAA